MKRRKQKKAFWVGAGSILDLGGTATYRAARSRHMIRTSQRGADWYRVGQDLRMALSKHEQQTRNAKAA